MALPFPSTPATSPTGPNLGPEQEPDAIHDGAPAGRFFGSDLPVVSVPGGQPAQYGGYSPESSNPQLPRDPMDGFTTPPTGIRR